MELVGALIGGLVLGGAVCFFFARALYRNRIEAAEAEQRHEGETARAVLEEKVAQWEARFLERGGAIEELEDLLREKALDLTARDKRIAELETVLVEERKNTVEKLALLEDASKKLKDTFSVLASEALKSNNEGFLELAKTQLESFQKEAKSDLEKRQESVAQMLAPVKESFQKFDKKIEDLEKDRSQAYGGITEQLKNLVETHQSLRSETGKLVNALRRPQARGRWGEIQLRNVVELAGMSEYCDFSEQVSVNDEEGAKLRPDLIVNLPGGKQIVVDSKVSLDAFMNAIETDDESQRQVFFAQHAQQVRTHIQQLSRKEYWRQFDSAPDFVVLFLPGEVYFSAALREEASLIEDAARNRVVLASPTTLIALLKAVSYGWQQEKVAENAREIAQLGKDLHDRICTLAEHFDSLGKSLRKATEQYNKSLRSLESRVLVTSRRFQELQVGSSKEIPCPEAVELEPNPLMVLELPEERPPF